MKAILTVVALPLAFGAVQTEVVKKDQLKKQELMNRKLSAKKKQLKKAVFGKRGRNPFKQSNLRKRNLGAEMEECEEEEGNDDGGCNGKECCPMFESFASYISPSKTVRKGYGLLFRDIDNGDFTCRDGTKSFSGMKQFAEYFCCDDDAIKFASDYDNYDKNMHSGECYDPTKHYKFERYEDAACTKLLMDNEMYANQLPDRYLGFDYLSEGCNGETMYSVREIDDGTVESYWSYNEMFLELDGTTNEVTVKSLDLHAGLLKDEAVLPGGVTKASELTPGDCSDLSSILSNDRNGNVKTQPVDAKCKIGECCDMKNFNIVQDYYICKGGEKDGDCWKKLEDCDESETLPYYYKVVAPDAGAAAFTYRSPGPFPSADCGKKESSNTVKISAFGSLLVTFVAFLLY